MSKNFPTHKQFIAEVRTRLRAEYREAAMKEREAFRDTLAMQTDIGTWLRHLGDLIEKGVKAEQPVLDTLTEDQLYSLRKIYAPRESLDWYIPATHRTNRSLEPRPKLTPDALFEYASKFSQTHETRQYPTFREAAKRFHATLSEIEDACTDFDTSKGYMAPATGYRTHNGIGHYGAKGDWRVEAYG